MQRRRQVGWVIREDRGGTKAESETEMGNKTKYF